MITIRFVCISLLVHNFKNKILLGLFYGGSRTAAHFGTPGSPKKRRILRSFLLTILIILLLLVASIIIMMSTDRGSRFY